ncbi:MAG: hypothetical protein GPJ54_07365, partial [Candidatus Heimdallarchaeota archaeon]|nr:hypothetical protein [Candidatus Heimdallarchaeota archaeon]
MNLRKNFAIMLTIIFLLSVNNVVGADSNDSYINNAASAPGFDYTPDLVTDGSPWYREGTHINFSPEGYIWSYVYLEGYPLSFGDLDADEMLVKDVNDLFLWGGFNTRDAENIYEENTNIDLTFRTNDPLVAEQAAWSVISLFNSQTPFDMHFDGSYGEDWYNGNNWEQVTHVMFNGRVEWTNMLTIVDGSIPRQNGGLAETIDTNAAHSLRYHFWNQGDKTVGISIGLEFQERIGIPDGGHSFNILELIHVTQFKKSAVSDSDLWMDIWLPDVTTPVLIPANTTDTQVFWSYHPSSETHNLHQAWDARFRLFTPTIFNDITLSFDYTFIQWSWQNRDTVWYGVDAKGFDTIEIQSYGYDRARLTTNIGAGSVMTDQLTHLGFYFNEQDNYASVNLVFVGWGDKSSQYSAIFAEINSELGLDFSVNTSYSIDENTQYYDRNNDNYQDASTYWVEKDVTGVTLEEILIASYGFNKSAALSNTTLSNFNWFEFNYNNDTYGGYGQYNLRYDLVGETNSYGQFITPAFNIAASTHFVDMLSFNYLGWTQLPWNSYSEVLEIHIWAPFNGNWETDIIPGVDTNNGWGWESWRNWNEEDGINVFDYHLSIYTDDPQYTDNDGNILYPISEFNVTFNNDFLNWDADIYDPQAYAYMYRDWAYPDLGFSDENAWNHYFGGKTFSGELSMAAIVNDADQGGQYLTGSEWLPKFPSSGIKNVNMTMFRTDATIDHERFTVNAPMGFNSTWDTSEVWTSSIDTTLLADGEWQLWSEMIDNAGNNQISGAATVQIDNYDGTNPASIAFTNAPANLEHISGITDFEFEVTDDVGTFVVIFWVGLGGYIVDPISTVDNGDGTVTQTFVYSLDTLFEVENRDLTVMVEVLDLDGFWSTFESHVIIDNVPSGNPPVIALLEYPADLLEINASKTPTVLFKVHVSEDVGIEFVKLIIGTNEFNLASIGNSEYEVVLDLTT